MTPVIDNAELGGTLDCQGFILRNVRDFIPVPPPLLDINSPILSGPRPVPDGSVTDYHVNANAEIDQSKLNFNGVMPSYWLGAAPKTAARGDQAQMISQKGLPNGYAPLDSSGFVSAARLSPSANPGTVNYVGIQVPPGMLVTGSPVTASGTITLSWAPQPSGSYFGLNGYRDVASAMNPSFITDPIPTELVPGIEGEKFVSGVFPVERLPVMVGAGAANASGLVPDPGEYGAGHETDYLGRDGQWHPMAPDVVTEPTCAGVQFTRNFKTGDVFNVTVRAMQKGSVLLYRVNDSNWKHVEPHPTTIDENSIDLEVKRDDVIFAYSARAGYNNSDLQTYRVREVR